MILWELKMKKVCQTVHLFSCFAPQMALLGFLLEGWVFHTISMTYHLMPQLDLNLCQSCTSLRDLNLDALPTELTVTDLSLMSFFISFREPVPQRFDHLHHHRLRHPRRGLLRLLRRLHRERWVRLPPRTTPWASILHRDLSIHREIALPAQLPVWPDKCQLIYFLNPAPC